MSYKLAIVVGHNKRSQGAVRPDTNETEYQYNTRLAKMIADIAANQHCEQVIVQVFYRDENIGSYSAEIRDVYNRVDQWGADASIELHFNAAGSPTATGTETFTSGSSRSTILAEEVQMEMVEQLGLRDRGVKVRNRRTKGRGYLSLVSGRAPAILVEPFFATSIADRLVSDTKVEQQYLAEAIWDGAVQGLKRF